MTSLLVAFWIAIVPPSSPLVAYARGAFTLRLDEVSVAISRGSKIREESTQRLARAVDAVRRKRTSMTEGGV